MKDQNKSKTQLIAELDEARERISKLEQSKSEWERVEDALRKSEERYRDLFEMVPVCLWEEDFSKVKNYLDRLRSSGVTDLQAHFQAHPEELVFCARLAKIVDANQATVQLSGVESKDQLLGSLDKLFIDESFNSFQTEIIALYEKGGIFQGENVNKSPQGNITYSEIKGKIAAGHEDTWSRYLVSQTDVTERKRVELELRESEERFRTIFDTEPECVKILNPDTTLVTMNPAGLAMIEVESLDVVVGQSILPIIDEEFRDDFKRLTDNVCQKGQNGMLEFRVTGLKGTSRWLETHAVPLRSSKGGITGLLGVTRDVTERVQAQGELKKLGAAVQQSPACVVITNLEGNIEYVNPKFTDLTGYSTEEVLGKNPRMLQSGEMSKEAYAQLWKTILSGKEWRGEFHNKKKNGELYWEDASISPIVNDNGDITHFLAVKENITERKKSEQALRAREAKLQSIFRAAPIGIGMTIDRVIQEANRMLCQMTGYTREELVGQNARMLYISTEDYEYVGNEKYRMIQERGVGTVETRWKRKDGEVRDILLSSVPLNPEDFSKGVTFTALDITERNQAEAYRTSLARIFDESLNEIYIFDADSLKFKLVNRAAQQNLGYSIDEFYKLTPLDIKPEYTLKAFLEMVEPLRFGKQKKLQFETVHRRKDDSLYAVEVHLQTTVFEKSPAFVAIIMDITQRKQAENDLRIALTKYKSLFNAVPLGITVSDEAGNILESNAMAEKLLGLSLDEQAQRAIDGNEWRIVRPDETPMPADEYASVRALKEKRLVENVEMGIVKSKETKTWLSVTADLLPLEGYGVVIAYSDISQRRQAELAVKESEARYRNIVESSPLGMHMYELQAPNKLVFSGSNPAADEILGVDNSIFVGKTIEDAFPPLTNTEVPERYKEAAEKGIPWKTEQIDYDSDGIKGAFEVVAFQTSPGKMVAMFQDITTRMQAEQALRMKTSELETLFSISKHLRAAKSADEMLPLVVNEMRSVLKADTSAIILLDQDEDNFRYASGDGLLASNMGKSFSTEKSISGLVLQTSEPYVTEDLSSDPMKASGLKGIEDLGPAVVVPLLSEEDFLGVLVCARTRDEDGPQFSSSEVELLTAIGEMVGNALRRARLYDQALMRLQNVQALRSIDMAISANMNLSVVLDVLLAQGSAQLDVDAASVLLFNPHTHTLEYKAGYGFRTKAIESAQLRINEGLPGQVMLDREFLFVPNLLESERLVRKKLLEEGFVSYRAAPLVAKGQLQGVLELFSRTPMKMDIEQMSFLETLAIQAAIAIDNAQLFDDLQRSNFELEIAYDATIEGWSRALELRDQETEGHTLRVAKMTERLAQAMGIDDKEMIQVRRGALLHDIGKMGVPDRILLKPGKLDGDEWNVMKQHAEYAFEMLWPIEFLRPALDIPHYHHERWDGTGYPRGLKGDQIPLSARIFAVVDVWDALNSDRPYRKAWTEKKALDYIKSNAGKLFDPHVVETFTLLLNDLDRDLHG